MTKRYTGGVVSSSLPTVNAAGASGVFSLSQQSDYQSRNAWPPYKVEESLRFRSSASAYLNRTPSVAGNRKTWTWSAWVKLGTIAASNGTLFNAGTTSGGSTRFYLRYTGSQFQTGYGSFNLDTTVAVFRDPSAWYHVVLAVDTTQATASNRIKIYVNGVQQAVTTSANYSQNDDTAVNNTVSHQIASDQIIPGGYYDGYMAEVNFIDGQALTPSSFGATDKDGNWSPIAYTGTYGTNGFYLNFSNNTSATTMGLDSSGNGNNWTLNGFNVSTANTTYDIMIDVPEDQAGANTRGNYCTLNSLTFWNSIGGGSLTNGNLTLTADSGNNRDTRAWGTMGVSTGKWYYETNVNAVDSTYMSIGVSNYILGANTGFFYGSNWVYHPDGNKVNSANPSDTGTSYGNTYTTNDIIGVAVDMDNGKIWFSKNGTWQASGDPVAGTNAAFTNLTSTTVYPIAYHWAAGSQQSPNFGQRPFTYTPPTGFKTLNTFNLPEPAVKQPNRHFDVKLWTGNDVSPRQVVSGLSFQPDFAWTKTRSIATQHALYDAVRGVGAGKILLSDTTNAEGGSGGTSDATYGYLSAFNSDGFTTTKGSDSINYFFNNGNYPSGAQTYVSWLWNAGGSTVTNTTGSISAQVRANPTAGFSIVTYTGPGSGGGTVGHGLGVAPSMIIIKNRSATESWRVGHSSMNGGSSPWNYYMNLNGTGGQVLESALWNNTAPTPSVFTIANDSAVSGSGNSLVAYCFAPIAGYSAFGSYTGNGQNNGPFIYTGFRPKFILYKQSSASGEYWHIMDSTRSPTNGIVLDLYPNLSNAEATYSPPAADFLSNGFKFTTDNGAWNGSGATYIYAAFAEAPFKYARAR